MIKKFEYSGVEIYYEDTKVNELEAKEVLLADIDSAKKYFSSEGRTWPKESWYKEEKIPVYHDVTYLLTDRGWLSDKQRADIIRQGNSSPDYEIIEPIQTKTKKEISHYESKKVFGGCTDVSLNKAVQLYWLYTRQTTMGTKIIVESKYKEKPFDYMTDSELCEWLEKASISQREAAINAGCISGEEVQRIQDIIDDLDSLY